MRLAGALASGDDGAHRDSPGKMPMKRIRGAGFMSVVLTTMLMLQPAFGQVARHGPNAAGAYSIRPLGALPGGTWSRAVAINNRGQIAGVSGSASGTPHAVLWDNGTIIDLDPSGAFNDA